MKGIIAAGDAATARAGAQILAAGGNAFDAALAAMLAAPESEPILSSMGGGGFMLASPAGGRPIVYDFFVDVPPSRSEVPEFYPIEVDFGTTTQAFHIGTASIAVPGMVAGIDRIHRDLSSLPMSDLVAPARQYAHEGVTLAPLQADLVQLVAPILQSTDEARSLFAPSGQLIDTQRPWHNPDYADFLDRFAREGAEEFYRGEIAREIETHSRTHGGHLRREDFENYQVRLRDPILFDYRARQVATNPPPSAGGILIAFALRMLAEKGDYPAFNSPDYLRDLVETFVTTEHFRREKVDAHLHRDDLAAILHDAPTLAHYLLSRQTRLNRWGNTTHISLIDSEGNAASVTSTNGEGSGRLIPGTGIMLNNMLGEEDLNPHGFFQWPPGVRLPSMMAPTMVFESGRPILALGSAGSNRIRSAITEVIERHIAFDTPIQSAIDAARLHYEKGQVFAEPGFDPAFLEELARHYALTQFEETNLFFGGVNAVTGNMDGGADHRRGGVVEVVS